MRHGEYFFFGDPYAAQPRNVSLSTCPVAFQEPEPRTWKAALISWATVHRSAALECLCKCKIEEVIFHFLAAQQATEDPKCCLKIEIVVWLVRSASALFRARSTKRIGDRPTRPTDRPTDTAPLEPSLNLNILSAHV